MKTVPLEAGYRSELGTQAVKKIRAAKRLPAIIYGTGMKATPIQVNLDAFSRVIHTKAGENVVIDLSVNSSLATPRGEGRGERALRKTVVIKEIQRHPVTDAVAHVDFNVISMTEQIKVKVPLHVTGESPGVKAGGVLDVIHHEIEVACLPTDIPERLEADISALNIGDSIHVRELTFPGGVASLLDSEEVVVAVHAPKLEEAPTPEEVPAGPEVIGKEKKEEGVEGAAEKPTAEGAKKEAKEAKGKPEKQERKEK